MIVTAAMVGELRARTGAGMMECKKALELAQGNVEDAITGLRKLGQAKVAKKAERIAANGMVIAKISSDGRTAVMLEINCETDFASRHNSFLAFANGVVAGALGVRARNLSELSQAALGDGCTVLEARDALIATIGENISVRRIALLELEQKGVIYSYIHGNGKIGVLLALSVVNAELGKDMAMHIAALNPMAILPGELAEELVAKEREIAWAAMQNSGKPKEIQEKIVSGKVEKFINEAVLVGQGFVKDPEVKIGDLLAKCGAQVNKFIRFELGEGIERGEVDFAAEVQLQINNTK